MGHNLGDGVGHCVKSGIANTAAIECLALYGEIVGSIPFNHGLARQYAKPALLPGERREPLDEISVNPERGIRSFTPITSRVSGTRASDAYIQQRTCGWINLLD